MGQLKYSVFGRSDIGRVRTKNEDSYLIDHEHLIYAVADGLGGLPGGALASQIAIREFQRAIDANSSPGIEFQSIFNVITEKVYEAGKDIGELGIATTLTGGQIIDSTLCIGHAGDSGLFIFSNDAWQKLTTDQTMAQEMRDAMEPGENKYIPDFYNHTLTACLGQTAPLSIHSYQHKLQAGEKILFFTDGVTKALQAEELHALAIKSKTPKNFIDTLIKECNIRGGPDNITAIALFVEN